MKRYLGNINIRISILERGAGALGNVLLPQKWSTEYDSKHYLAHELAHIWDAKTGPVGLTFFPGTLAPVVPIGIVDGMSDQLNAFIDDTLADHRGACRFCDQTGTAYIPAPYQYPTGSYGNNSTMDYLADSFANAIYYPLSIPDPSVTGWINDSISSQATNLP